VSDGPADPAPTERERTIARLRAGATDRVARASDGVQRWRERSVVVDTLWRIAERDRTSFGTVVGSAIALRLFLFYLPLVLTMVGLLGVLGRHLDADSINETAGLTSAIADQIAAATDQEGSGSWFALGFGLVAMLFTGRSLARVLIGGSALAWNVDVARAKVLQVLVRVLLVSTMLAVAAAVVNRVRIATGVAVGGLTLIVVAVVFLVLWLLLLTALPATTTDPGAQLPGAVVLAVVLAGLQAFTQLLLADRLAGASALYGAIGVSTVIVGWLFVVGRAAMLSFVVNAVVYERFGSISGFVFGLPVLRILPRRVPAIARFFDLERDVTV
jgi:uncharacterized BrkB/YihY/UPF0761 family membrane protein